MVSVLLVTTVTARRKASPGTVKLAGSRAHGVPAKKYTYDGGPVIGYSYTYCWCRWPSAQPSLGPGAAKGSGGGTVVWLSCTLFCWLALHNNDNLMNAVMMAAEVFMVHLRAED